jgi:hypothetical protein
MVKVVHFQQKNEFQAWNLEIHAHYAITGPRQIAQEASFHTFAPCYCIFTLLSL